MGGAGRRRKKILEEVEEGGCISRRPRKAAVFDWSRKPVFQPSSATFSLGDLWPALDSRVSKRPPALQHAHTTRDATKSMETFEGAQPLRPGLRDISSIGMCQVLSAVL